MYEAHTHPYHDAPDAVAHGTSQYIGEPRSVRVLHGSVDSRTAAGPGRGADLKVLGTWRVERPDAVGPPLPRGGARR